MTSFARDAQARPPRVSFANLSTGESIEMPFVPEEVTETIAVKWANKEVLGQSHEPKQYQGTGSYQLPGLTFFFRGTSPEEVDAIHDGRRFLMSCCVPSGFASTVRTGGAARLLMVWPEFISMTFVIDSISNRHIKFNRAGKPVVWYCTLNLSEIRDVRLTSEEVRERGTFRSGSGAEEV